MSRVTDFGPFLGNHLWQSTLFALCVAALAGCKHKNNTSLETPAGTTSMNVQGNAMDANGNPLNASRTVSIMLVVTAD